MIQKKKVKHPSKELGIQLQKDEKVYQELVKEKQSLLEIKARETEIKTQTLTLEYVNTKKQVILVCGDFLERHGLERPDRISRRLTKDFGRFFPRGYVSKKAHELKRDHWVQKPRGESNMSSARSNRPTAAKKDAVQELSEQERQYVQAHEQELKRNEKIADLLYFITNKTIQEQNKVITSVPRGSDFKKALMDASHDYMFKLSKQMLDSDVSTTLWDLGLLEYAISRFRDVLYSEQENRKRTKEVLKE